MEYDKQLDLAKKYPSEDQNVRLRAIVNTLDALECKIEAIDEPSDPSDNDVALYVLQEIREILRVPENEDICKYAKEIMEKVDNPKWMTINTPINLPSTYPGTYC